MNDMKVLLQKCVNLTLYSAQFYCNTAISRSQPRIEAKIDVKLFGGQENTVEVKARLEEDSGLRFTETYESASVLGQQIDLPDVLQYSRDLYVSYVDEDILVVRDGAGVPEILVRK